MNIIQDNEILERKLFIMKIRKIFAGMAASAIAMTSFAMVSAPAASAAETASGHAGITFQADGTWNYRNTYNNTDQSAAFPEKKVGIQGGAYGIDTEASFNDIDINGDGTYTVSMSTSGTIKVENSAAVDEGKSKWIADEASGITREGSKWSILHNFEPKTNDGSETLTKDNLTWEAGGDGKVFNILSVSTDIPVSFNADGDATPEEMKDKPVFDGRVVEVTDVVVTIQGNEYPATEDVKFSYDPKVDQNYLTIMLIDKWNKNNTIDPAAFPTEEDGEISVTFTVKGLSAPADDSSSTADSSSAADSSSSSSSSSTSNNSSSKSSTTTTTSTTKTTTTTTTTTTASTASAASDNTENAASGAPAGIALALAAVAGAAVVVSRKK